MSYGRLKAKEKELTEKIEDLTEKAAKYDEEDSAIDRLRWVKNRVLSMLI